MDDDIDAGEPHENWLLRHSFLASWLLVAPVVLASLIPPSDIQEAKAKHSTPSPALVAGYTPK